MTEHVIAAIGFRRYVTDCSRCQAEVTLAPYEADDLEEKDMARYICDRCDNEEIVYPDEVESKFFRLDYDFQRKLTEFSTP